PAVRGTRGRRTVTGHGADEDQAGGNRREDPSETMEGGRWSSRSGVSRLPRPAVRAPTTAPDGTTDARSGRRSAARSAKSAGRVRGASRRLRAHGKPWFTNTHGRAPRQLVRSENVGDPPKESRRAGIAKKRTKQRPKRP